jgi:hypothetical protein
VRQKAALHTKVQPSVASVTVFFKEQGVTLKELKEENIYG